MPENDDNWAEGAAYETFMGRWSRTLATNFIAWLDPVPRLRWLDVGCGTGALSSTIIQSADPDLVIGCDPAAPFIEYASAQPHDPRLFFLAATLQALPQISGGFDSAVSGLVLNFVEDPVEAIRAMMQRVAPGGLVAAYVWDYAGRMEFLRFFWDAAVNLDPAAAAYDEGGRFPLCQPAALASTFQQAGLIEVRTEAIDIPTVFHTFSDYWRPFLAGTGPAPNYVASLNAGRQKLLASSLQRRLESAGGGIIPMIARAWAVRGKLE